MTPPKTLGRFCWHFYKKQPLAFTVFFLAPCLMVLEVTVIPYALKMIVDVIATSADHRQDIFRELSSALFLLGGVWVTMITLVRLQNWWQAYVLPRFQADIRLSVLEYVIGHSYQYFSNQFAGNIANKVADLARSIDLIRMIVSWNVISALATTLVSILILLMIAPLFALILGLWVIAHLTITALQATKVNHISRINAEDKSQLTGSIVDVLTNIIPLKLFASKRYEMNFVAEKQGIEIVSNKKTILAMNVLKLWMDIFLTIMLGTMIYFLLKYWQLKYISAGDLVFIFNVFFAIMNQMWHLGMALADLFREIGVSKQALSLINPPHDINDNPNAKQLKVM